MQRHFQGVGQERESQWVRSRIMAETGLFLKAKNQHYEIVRFLHPVSWCEEIFWADNKRAGKFSRNEGFRVERKDVKIAKPADNSVNSTDKVEQEVARREAIVAQAIFKAYLHAIQPDKLPAHSYSKLGVRDPHPALAASFPADSAESLLVGTALLHLHTHGVVQLEDQQAALLQGPYEDGFSVCVQ